jgi:bisphosphoglycerate-dependent phosphoglycerate mutase
MAHVTARPLVVLRHAQSLWNLENRSTGWADALPKPGARRRARQGRC